MLLTFWLVDVPVLYYNVHIAAIETDPLFGALNPVFSNHLTCATNKGPARNIGGKKQYN